MFDVDRILAIPDESIDYLQMGISGGERAALAARGFVRKDGIKAKDYMIRTIQKTEKNKAKAEKAIIKGDKKLAEAPDKKELEQRLRKINEEIQTPYLVGAKFKPLVVSNPDRFESLSKEAKEINKSLGNKKREFYKSTQDQASTLLRMPAARHKKYVEDALKSGKTVPDEVLKDYPDLSKKYSQSPSNRGLAITDKKGFQSESGAVKKIKGAIAGVKGGKVVKGVSPRDRASFISKSLQNTLGENNFLVKNKHEGVKLIEDAIKNNRGNLEADSMGKLQVLKINKPSKKFPYGSASIVVDNSTLGKGYGRERSTVDLVYLADNARKLAKKQDSASPMERLDRLVKLGDELKPKQPSAAKKLAVTYNKKGDLSEGAAAKKIKGAIATTSATPKSRKVVKGMSPRLKNMRLREQERRYKLAGPVFNKAVSEHPDFSALKAKVDRSYKKNVGRLPDFSPIRYLDYSIADSKSKLSQDVASAQSRIVNDLGVRSYERSLYRGIPIDRKKVVSKFFSGKSSGTNLKK